MAAVTRRIIRRLIRKMPVMRFTMVAAVIALTLLVLSGVALPDNCPHCGGAYDDLYPNSAADHIRNIRANHESTCPSRQTPGPVYWNEVNSVSLETQRILAQAALELARLNTLVNELSAESQALFSTIKGGDPSNINDAMDRVMQEWRTAVSRNAWLRRETKRLEERVRSANHQILAADSDSARLLREIGEQERTIVELEQELRTLSAELAQAKPAVETLTGIASKTHAAVIVARSAFFTAVGDFFRNQDLGEPRDYITRVEPRPVSTERRLILTKGSLTPVIPERVEMPETVIITPIRATWTQAFPGAVEGRRLAPVGTEARFKDLIEQWNAARHQNQQSSRLNQQLLLDGDRALAQLQASISAQQRFERERTWVGDRARELADRVDADTYELRFRTGQAMGIASEIGTALAKEKRWDLAKKLWDMATRAPNAGDLGSSMLKLTYGLVAGDLSKVPTAAINADDPSVRDLVNQLENTFQTRGTDFLKGVFNVEERPLPGQKWIEDNILSRSSRGAKK